MSNGSDAAYNQGKKGDAMNNINMRKNRISLVFQHKKTRRSGNRRASDVINVRGYSLCTGKGASLYGTIIPQSAKRIYKKSIRISLKKQMYFFRSSRKKYLPFCLCVL